MPAVVEKTADFTSLHIINICVPTIRRTYSNKALVESTRVVGCCRLLGYLAPWRVVDVSGCILKGVQVCSVVALKLTRRKGIS